VTDSVVCIRHIVCEGCRERRGEYEVVVCEGVERGLEGTIQVDLKEIGAYRDRSEVEIGRAENGEYEGGKMHGWRVEKMGCGGWKGCKIG